MRRPFEQYQSEEKGALKNAFDQSNPEYWEKLQGRPQDIERAKEIIDHTEEAIRIVEENYREERQERVAKIAVEVWNERTRHYDHLVPHTRADLFSENSILSEARRRCDEQHRKDLANIQNNQKVSVQQLADGEQLYGQTTSTEEIAKMTDQQKKTHFKAELHKLIDDSSEARFQVSKIMNNERDRMLKEAKESGSQDPYKDVQGFQSRMYRDVQEKLHGDIHALCIKYGYEVDRQQVEFHANPENKSTEHVQDGETQGTESGQTENNGDNDTVAYTVKIEDDDQSQ